MYFFRSSKEGSSGYSANSTAEQVTEGIDGTGLTAIVTGASSGIGAETARVLALRGVHVVMAVRNVDAGKKVRGEIVGEIANAKVDAMELDLSSMKSIGKFASEYVSSSLPLNILINNAGILYTDKFRLSKDNIELTFATNHIGHFLLTNLLLDTMTRTTRVTKREGRIVNVSSSSHSQASEIKFDRINDEQGIKGGVAYMRSKLANVLHANELARRLKAQEIEITANSLHPGIINTNIMRNQRYTGAIFNFFFKDKDIHQGAATQCYVALHPQLKGVSGKYFSDCNECEASCVATNEEMGKKLWDFSISLTNNS